MQDSKLAYAWGAALLGTLNDMRKDEEMCDLKIVLKDNLQVKVHSCVLAAASPFLKSLLHDTHDAEINMEDFPVGIMQQIIEFIYTGEARIKKSDLLLLHSVAVSLDIQILSDLAHKMINCSTDSESLTLTGNSHGEQDSPAKRKRLAPIKYSPEPEASPEKKVIIEKNTKRGRPRKNPIEHIQILDDMESPLMQAEAPPVDDVTEHDEEHSDAQMALMALTENVTASSNQGNLLIKQEQSDESHFDPEGEATEMPGADELITEPPGGESVNSSGKRVYRKAKLRGVALGESVPIHDGPTYPCDMCNKAFTDEDMLIRHWNSHRRISDKKRFACGFCSFTTEYKATLDEHTHGHTGETPYTCSHCGRSFRHRKSWQDHVCPEKLVGNSQDETESETDRDKTHSPEHADGDLAFHDLDPPASDDTDGEYSALNNATGLICYKFFSRNKNSSSLQDQRIIDNQGHCYSFKAEGKRGVRVWRCVVRRRKAHCPGIVRQKGSSISRGKLPHSHPPKQESAEIFAGLKTRIVAMEDPVQIMNAGMDFTGTTYVVFPGCTRRQKDKLCDSDGHMYVNQNRSHDQMRFWKCAKNSRTKPCSAIVRQYEDFFMRVGVHCHEPEPDVYFKPPEPTDDFSSFYKDQFSVCYKMVPKISRGNFLLVSSDGHQYSRLTQEADTNIWSCAAKGTLLCKASVTQVKDVLMRCDNQHNHPGDIQPHRKLHRTVSHPNRRPRRPKRPVKITEPKFEILNRRNLGETQLKPAAELETLTADELNKLADGTFTVTTSTQGEQQDKVLTIYLPEIPHGY